MISLDNQPEISQEECIYLLQLFSSDTSTALLKDLLLYGSSLIFEVLYIIPDAFEVGFP